MSSLETNAANLVLSIAASKGKDIDWTAALAVGKELIDWGVELVDDSAKKKAEAAGDAAGAAIKTEDQAESELRKP